MRSGLRYGVGGWPYVAGLSAAAAGLAVTAGVLRRRPVTAALLAAGAAAAAIPAALGARYVLAGKLSLRDRLLAEIAWRGDEVVADLGARAGLLAVGAARRTTGTVHAIDLFIGKDLLGNSERRLRANAAFEGVADRIQVHRQDVRATGLPAGSVDVVFSSLCLHNLGSQADRRAALDEIMRILRPGGTVVISDLAHVDDE